MKIVIIGNGIAGINTASVLSTNKDLSIEVYGDESYPFYSRIRLPDVLSGEVPPEAITFYKPDWYEKKGFSVHTSTVVSKINREEKKILLDDGTEVSWDFLVIATGASCNHPPIEGSSAPGIFTLRTQDDVKAIRESIARNPESASVIGGGLLGLEAARALKDAGVRLVRVLEIFPRLLPRQLDETGSALLQKRFTAMGIEVVCSAETSDFIIGAENGLPCNTIELKDGRSFLSGTTILSMGVHSNTDLAKNCGLSVKRGICVNEFMQTTDPSIYAVGDCAEFGGIVWGIIPAALEQAPVAAKHILSVIGYLEADQAPVYTQTVPKTALKVGDVELLSMGKAVLTPEEISSGAFDIMSRVWEDELRYEKYVIEKETEVLVGAIVYGSKLNQSAIQKMSGKKIDRSELEVLLAN
ncbi:MAG TPA: FAD-dependent oxidoreductase [Treponemataceae bacterium]|nr:FAD-dependent oxidoreductase [Treponemataceae bacterium]